ncbi:Alcohol dehydrogenase 2 [Hordeum vulgare]|nr:Alcohol dehydrogenase 2 [Hordeum vulgare]
MATAGKVIKCKAAVAWEAGKPLSMEEVEVAPPQAMEVRDKILYTALCHTDVYFWEANVPLFLNPHLNYDLYAHGIVESVGEDVTELVPGDHVLPVFTGECKECAHCMSEESNLCDLLRINVDRGVMIDDGQSRFTIDGKPIFHFLGTSTFSEYTVIHVGCVAKIDPEAPLDKVCLLSCGISTGLGATLNVTKPKKGMTLAIFGLGAVGLAAMEGARMSGASRIIGVDLNPAKHEQGTHDNLPLPSIFRKKEKKILHPSWPKVIVEMTDGGVNRAVECTGNADAMISAFECVHDGWGVAHKEAVFKTHPMNFLNERTLRGTFFGNYKPRTGLPGVVDMYMRKELELDKFITHSLPFSQINTAFDLMLRGEGLRCFIRMEE